MLRAIGFVLGIVLTHCGWSWNAMGHQLIAQIAYDQLTPEAKQLVNSYNRALDCDKRYTNFIKASIWLDDLRAHDVHWYDSFHYIDIPFTSDSSPLTAVPEVNAKWAVKHSLKVLSSSKSSKKDKGLSLRILIHVVGDIHQPLHTIARVTKRHPKGDLGGNLFLLGKNSVGRNLHEYWDNGAGVLTGSKKKFQIRNKAHQLERKWSCVLANKSKNLDQWIQDSHQLATTQAYSLKEGKTPGKNYQLNAQHLTERQILFAGCRLGTLLNKIPILR